MAAALNIKANPEDATLAQLWLGRLGPMKQNDGLTQSVLTVLADVHYAHPEIARQLIPLFLGLGRVDFSARRLYRHFSDQGETSSPEDDALRAGIIELIGRSSAELSRTLGDQRNGPGRFPAETRTSPDIIRPYFLQGGRLTAQGIRRGGRWLSNFAGALGRGLLSVRGLKSPGAVVWNSVLKTEKLRVFFRWGLMGLLGVWLVLFVWNTLSHMLKSTDQPARLIEVRISKPLTIQVAAYLKQAHADRYLAALEAKGITARVKKTEAGGQTWYLVRVSEFTDKKSAENYGNHLKSQKIIDDFFVSNK